MGHNFKLPVLIPLEDIEIQKAPKIFGGKREGWWQVEYKGKQYKFFGSTINLEDPEAVGYDQIIHAKKLAAEAIKLNTVEEVN